MMSLRLSIVPLVLALFLLPACEPADVSPPEAEGVSAAEALQEAIRPEVGGIHGAVVAGHPLAAAAGYEVLRQGGTATDAVVTMAGILAVVRPHMNNVGGDAFALFYDAETGRVDALNGSGRAAAGATPELFAEREIDRMPGSGALSVTVPGAVAAWADALERHGTLSLAQALEPAIALARDGFMVSETLARDLRGARRLNEGGQEIYMPGGELVEAGQLLTSSALANTLEAIAAQGPSALYGGSVGESIVAFLQEEGSPMELSDLAAHESTWTEPARVPFRDYQVLSMPANSQGMALLQILGMADALPLEEYGPDSAELLHSLIEFKKMAFADRDRWIADPEVADVPMDRLVDPEYLRERAGQISDRAAMEYDHGFGEPLVDERELEDDDSGDTVYLMAVDPDGNAVSWIQSLFSSFGSGLVDPGTGVVLQNRGAGFTLQEDHPNRIAPGKRPFHTLLPAMVLDGDGGFVMTAGTPGGHGQPQTVAQVIIQTLVYGLSPQAAVEYPRFRSEDGVEVLLEDRMPAAAQEGLTARGHELDLASGWTAPFGNAQVIQRLPSGILRTGADMRREGHSLAW
jgi:gamma-glutamyltranspeptidase / glutathione hydrolase